jgi:hypothetical protein
MEFTNLPLKCKVSIPLSILTQSMSQTHLPRSNFFPSISDLDLGTHSSVWITLALNYSSSTKITHRLNLSAIAILLQIKNSLALISCSFISGGFF